MKSIFKLVDFEEGRLPSIMQVSLTQSVEGLDRTEGTPPLSRRNFAADSH